MIAFLYDMIYTIPLALSSVILLHDFLGAGSMRAMVVATILCCFLLILFRHLKVRGRIVLGGGLGALLAGAAVVGKTELLKEGIWVLWILLIAAAAYALSLLCSRYEIARIAVGLITLTVLVALMIVNPETPKSVFTLLFFYVSVSVCEVIQNRWPKEGHTDVKKHITWMCPFLILPFLILATVPVNDKPYDWKFVKTFLKEARIRYEVILQTLIPEQTWDSDTNMGFSDRAVLNGHVEGDPYTVFTVYADADNDYRIYMGGKTFDTFDGRQWTKRDTAAIDYRALDRIETISAILSRDPEHIGDYVRSVYLTVTYRGLRTAHVFMPPKSYPDALSDPMTETGGDLVLKSGKKADYALRYDRLNRDNPIFRELMRNAGDFDEAAWNKAVEQYGGARKEGLTSTVYREYRERIDTYYRDEVVLSDRAHAFLDELLAGASDDFTKCERIEAYLGGLNYNRTPGELPDYVQTGADFIDYLLFEKQEGFCTHFATAFVLLTRSQGIPARYVQGYSVLTTNRNFEVLSNRAHAWPEVYLQGIGWITFEPTPGYKKTSGWALTGEAGELYTGYVYAERPFGDGVSGSLVDINLEDAWGDGGKEGDTQSATPAMQIKWRWILIPLSCALLFLILFVIADRIWRRVRYRRMGARDRIVTLSRQNLRTLRFLGLKLQDGETLHEYKQRAMETVPVRLLDFVDGFEYVIYGAVGTGASGSVMADTMISDMEQNSTMVRKYVLSELIGRIGRTFLRRREK